jgi:glucose/arabinose dehydrogenase
MGNSDLVTRTLLMSQKQDGTLLVSRGSSDGNTTLATAVTSGLSQIRAFNVANLTSASAPYPFSSSGTVLGWGLRNSVGVGEHPVTGGIYAVENSVDGVTRNGKDVHENNPGEELNFFGYLNGTTTANQGANFGYPVCFAVWQVDEIPDNAGLSIGKQFATQENATLSDETCAEKYVPPRLTFPAHYAPLDIKFSAGGETAYVSFRGSCKCFAFPRFHTPYLPWIDPNTVDRSSPVGYRVASIAFNAATGDPVAAASSSDVLTDILTNANITACPDKCFRPVGLAFDGSGRLWMSSDSTGEIYVLQKTGESGAGVFVQPPASSGGSGGTTGSGSKSAATGVWTRETMVLGWSAAAGIAFCLAVF